MLEILLLLELKEIADQYENPASKNNQLEKSMTKKFLYP